MQWAAISQQKQSVKVVKKLPRKNQQINLLKERYAVLTGTYYG
jgi:hypothetical protein